MPITPFPYLSISLNNSRVVVDHCSWPVLSACGNPLSQAERIACAAFSAAAAAAAADEAFGLGLQQSSGLCRAARQAEWVAASRSTTARGTGGVLDAVAVAAYAVAPSPSGGGDSAWLKLAWGKGMVERMEDAPVADSSTHAGDAVGHAIDGTAYQAAGAGNSTLHLTVEPVVVGRHDLRYICDVCGVGWKCAKSK